MKLFDWQNMLQIGTDKIIGLIPRPALKSEDRSSIKLVAHRGHHKNGIIENTIPAFRACREAQVWGIEFDLQWTQDNEPVVIHDDNTSRTFKGTALNVTKCNWKELKTQCPQIPHLSEVLDEFSKNLHLMLEVKTKLSDSQADRLQRLLAHLEPCTDFHILSLHPELFEPLIWLPLEACILVAELNLSAWSRLALEKNYGGLTGHYLLLTNKFIELHHGQKQKIGTGFIPSANILKREFFRSVDWFFTNDAIELQRWLNSDEP